MKELKRCQFLIDLSLKSKDRWYQEEIEKRESLREEIRILKGRP